MRSENGPSAKESPDHPEAMFEAERAMPQLQ
jgi:hypothetical protein